jgi:hypothetical protein
MPFIFRHQKTTTATFTDNTAILATNEEPAVAPVELQATVSKIDWANKWRIEINKSKSTHITFTLCNKTCLAVLLYCKKPVKYLAMQLDRRLT